MEHWAWCSWIGKSRPNLQVIYHRNSKHRRSSIFCHPLSYAWVVQSEHIDCSEWWTNRPLELVGLKIANRMQNMQLSILQNDEKIIYQVASHTSRLSHGTLIHCTQVVSNEVFLKLAQNVIETPWHCVKAGWSCDPILTSICTLVTEYAPNAFRRLIPKCWRQTIAGRILPDLPWIQLVLRFLKNTVKDGLSSSIFMGSII